MRRVLSLERKLYSLMVLYIRGNLKMVRDMDLVFRCGLMVPDTKACGETTSLVAEASSSTLMVMSMMVRHNRYLLSSIEFNDFIVRRMAK